MIRFREMPYRLKQIERKIFNNYQYINNDKNMKRKRMLLMKIVKNEIK